MEANERNLPAVRTERQGAALPVTTMNELAVAGQMLAQSGMFGVQNDAAGFVVAATCHQQGISLMEFNRTYHIVEGRPSMRADAMLAEFRKRGGRYKIVENSPTRAAAVFSFEGNELPFEFTADDAKRTGDCYKGDGKTIKAIWLKRPEDMLWARMVSRAVRRLCPEINSGLYAPEEVADFDDNQRQRSAPVALSPEEAVARAKSVTAEGTVSEATVVAPAEIDYAVCPPGYGDFSGVRWDAMDADMLDMALNASEGMDVRHYEEIHKAIEKIAAKGGAA